MSVKMKTSVKLRVQANCSSHSRTDISVRDVGFSIDEPEERGGTNVGPTPTDTALSALAGCTNTIGHKCASKLGVNIGNLTINIVADFDRRGVTLMEEIEVPFEAIQQEVIFSGSATDAEIASVAEEVEKFCPLAKLFSGAGTKLSTTWRRTSDSNV